jgi:hypothetical protein
MILNENNKSILDLLNYVDSKIIELRKNKNLDEEILSSLSKIYLETIEDWMSRNYLISVEPNKREEEEIINNLLELIDILNSI